VATINLHVPEELLAQLQEKAAAEGRSVDELATEALKKGLSEHSWQELLEYGRKNAASSGYTELDVPRLVKEWRREQRSR
jgi:hypothetical protein